MRIMVNGQWRQTPSGISIAELLEVMSLPARRVAVELNQQLVPRAKHAQTHLADEDRLEIVTLVGGG